MTAAGFVDLLLHEQRALVAAAARLEFPITLEGMQFIPEDAVAVPSEEGRSFRSPRTLVREYGTTRTVPESIGRWLLVDPATWHGKGERFRLWASHAVPSILQALPTEIDHNNKAHAFRGPPRLALEPLSTQQNIFDGLAHDGFQNLQAAARWIYELDREAENRHTLFANEFARTGTRCKPSCGDRGRPRCSHCHRLCRRPKAAVG